MQPIKSKMDVGPKVPPRWISKSGAESGGKEFDSCQCIPQVSKYVHDSLCADVQKSHHACVQGCSGRLHVLMKIYLILQPYIVSTC